MQKYFSVITTVAAVIVSDDGRVLLTKRNIEPFKDTWCLPGGHINQNEKVYDATKREVEEETGLVFEGTFFGWFEEIFPRMEIHNVVMVFAGSGAGSFTVSDEVREMRWFDKSEIKNVPLAFTHKDVLEKYFFGLTGI